jgi:hypothetical protein
MMKMNVTEYHLLTARLVLPIALLMKVAVVQVHHLAVAILVEEEILEFGKI